MILYHAPMTRSTRVKWLLEELQLPHETVTFDLFKGDQKTPEHLKRHPHGVVPVLVDEGKQLIESVAICFLLAERYPEKGLRPNPKSPHYSSYYQWGVYSAATVDPLIANIFTHTQFLPTHLRRPELVEWSKKEYAVANKFVEEYFADGKKYALGDEFTAADLMIGFPMFTGRMFGILEGKNVNAYVDRLSERPAFKRAFVA
jgi:glutathione S-transferase